MESERSWSNGRLRRSGALRTRARTHWTREGVDVAEDPHERPLHVAEQAHEVDTRGGTSTMRCGTCRGVFAPDGE